MATSLRNEALDTPPTAHIRYDDALENPTKPLERIDQNRTYESAELRLLEVHKAVLDGDDDQEAAVWAIEAALMEFNSVVPDMPLATGKGRRMLLNAQMMALASSLETDPARRAAWRKTALERLVSARGDFEPAARNSYRGTPETQLVKDRFAPNNLYTYIDRVQAHRYAEQWEGILSQSDADDEQWYTFAANLQIDDQSGDDSDKTRARYDLPNLKANALFNEAWERGVPINKHQRLLTEAIEAAVTEYTDLHQLSETTPLTHDQQVTQAALALTYGKATHDLATAGNYTAKDRSEAYVTAFCALNESLRIVNSFEPQLLAALSAKNQPLPYIDELGDIQLHHLKQELRDILMPLACAKQIRDEAFHFKNYQYPKEDREAAKTASSITRRLERTRSGSHESAPRSPYSPFIKLIGRYALDVQSDPISR